MKDKLISALMILSGVIHLLPVSGVRGPEQLSKLYGLSFESPDLLILMRHRAVLFGLLGVLLIYGALQPRMRALALGFGLISVISFLYLAFSANGYGPPIGRVVVADLVALVCLSVAVALTQLKDKKRTTPTL